MNLFLYMTMVWQIPKWVRRQLRKNNLATNKINSYFIPNKRGSAVRTNKSRKQVSDYKGNMKKAAIMSRSHIFFAQNTLTLEPAKSRIGSIQLGMCVNSAKPSSIHSPEWDSKMWSSLEILVIRRSIWYIFFQSDLFSIERYWCRTANLFINAMQTSQSFSERPLIKAQGV